MATNNAKRMTMEQQLADTRETLPRVRRRPGVTTKRMVDQFAAELEHKCRSHGDTLSRNMYRRIAQLFVCPTDSDYRGIVDGLAKLEEFRAQ